MEPSGCRWSSHSSMRRTPNAPPVVVAVGRWRPRAHLVTTTPPSAWADPWELPAGQVTTIRTATAAFVGGQGSTDLFAGQADRGLLVNLVVVAGDHGPRIGEDPKDPDWRDLDAGRLGYLADDGRGDGLADLDKQHIVCATSRCVDRSGRLSTVLPASQLGRGPAAATVCKRAPTVPREKACWLQLSDTPALGRSPDTAYSLGANWLGSAANLRPQGVRT